MRFDRILPRMTMVAAAAVLAGCSTLRPGTEAPNAPQALAPAAFKHAAAIEPAAASQAPSWNALGDPALERLLRDGLADNLDLQQALARVQRSRALAAAQRAELAPGGGATAGGSVRQVSSAEAPGADRDERRTDTVSAGLGAAWEIDLSGRLRHRARAAERRVDAADAQAQAVRLAVAAEIAHAWYALDGAREALRIARDVARNRHDTLALVLRRVAAGYHAPLDEARARAEAAAADAELPAHEAAVAVNTHRLAVLLGASPSTFEPPPAAPGTARAVSLRVPEPSRWMAARPDLRAAELALQAQALDVAAVRAEFMPRLTIEGVVGFVAGSLAGLGSGGSLSWWLAPKLSLPLFDTGRIEARLQAAQASQREALIAYRQSVLLATEAVESGLVRVRDGQVRLAALHERARQAATAGQLARKRFDAGASDLLELLDAQRQSRQADLEYAAALTAQRQHVVGLQHALGAGFGHAGPDGQAG